MCARVCIVRVGLIYRENKQGDRGGGGQWEKTEVYGSRKQPNKQLTLYYCRRNEVTTLAKAAQ